MLGAVLGSAHRAMMLAALPAFGALPAAIVGELLHMDELNTESEELTLLAMTPWLSAPGRSGSDVVSALGGLRWAWLSLEVVLRALWDYNAGWTQHYLVKASMVLSGALRVWRQELR